MSREAMKLALEEMKVGNYNSAAERLETALAEQPAQYGWTTERIAGMARLKEAQDKKLSQRTWQGLTDEEVMEIAFNFDVSSLSLVAKAIEAKLKEKNNG